MKPPLVSTPGKLEYARRYAQKRRAGLDSDALREEQRQRNQQQKEKKRALVTEAKAGGCADCGVMRPPELLDLHHVEPKSFSLSAATYKPIWAVVEEIAKCVCLCPNCHTLRHYNERQAGFGRYV